MSEAEIQTTAPLPERPRFQFGLRTLFLLFVVLGSSMAVFGAGGVPIFLLMVGFAFYVRVVESLRSLAYFFLVVLGLPCLLILLPHVGSAPSGSRSQCINNLHQIALALQNYHTANGCFPPAYTADKNGKPLLSWRVLILPYMDQVPLHNVFNLSEPWDGPKNKRLAGVQMREYICPSAPTDDKQAVQQTSYVAVVGARAAWSGELPRKLTDFSGKESDSIMLIEVANSGIAWSEPRDFSSDTLRATGSTPAALEVLSSHGHFVNFFGKYNRRAGINVAMADGRVRYVPQAGLTEENLQKLLAIGGGKQRELESYEDKSDGEWAYNWPNIAALGVWLVTVGLLLAVAVRGRKVCDHSSVA